MPRQQALRGTYRVTFIDGNQIIVGNNYKPWYTHAYEWARWKYDPVFLDISLDKVEYSDTGFVDDGGLKYATPAAYQEVIDEMSAKDQVQYKPYADIEFHDSIEMTRKLNKELKK